MKRKISVVEYDPRWVEEFLRIRERLMEVVGDVALGIEHVGSTAVPGLAAKAIIDVDVVVGEEDMGTVIGRLAKIGCMHRGDLGIVGREAFTPMAGFMEHHLYVVRPTTVGYLEHMALRDYLRGNAEAATAYGMVKKAAAMVCRDDIDVYLELKGAFIREFLRRAGEANAD